MSHIAVRILANRLADPDEGINAVVGMDLPIDEGDSAPGDVRVYSELDRNQGWVARRKVPQPDSETSKRIEWPCVVVYMVSLSDAGGVAQSLSTGARATEGSVTLAAQVLMRNSDTECVATLGMYLLRALRGVVHRFNDPAVLAERTALGTQLLLATAMQQGGVQAFSEDSVYSPGAILVTYSFVETVPLT